MNTKDVIKALENPSTKLNFNDWEISFFNSVCQQVQDGRELTGKQQVKLWDMYLKHVKGEKQ